MQKKGTRGAKRRLRRIEQRERRLTLQANHTLAKQIIAQHPHALIGLEHLTDIQERTERRKRKRKKNGKGYEPVSVKARKANRVYSQWSFAQLHTLISYKAALAGSLAVKVDASYTSQACPMCGHMSEKNRPQKGLLFVCQQCQYCLHADLVGARNITMRALLVRQDWARTGCLLIWGRFIVAQPGENALVDTPRTMSVLLTRGKHDEHEVVWCAGLLAGWFARHCRVAR